MAELLEHIGLYPATHSLVAIEDDGGPQVRLKWYLDSDRDGPVEEGAVVRDGVVVLRLGPALSIDRKRPADNEPSTFWTTHNVRERPRELRGIFVTREVFHSWAETRRDDWSQWFEAHDLSLDDIAEFSIDEGNAEVHARVYLRNEDGRRYPGEDGEPAYEVVTLPVGVLDVGTVADLPGTKTRLMLPKYDLDR